MRPLWSAGGQQEPNHFEGSPLTHAQMQSTQDWVHSTIQEGPYFAVSTGRSDQPPRCPGLSHPNIAAWHGAFLLPEAGNNPVWISSGPNVEGVDWHAPFISVLQAPCKHSPGTESHKGLVSGGFRKFAVTPMRGGGRPILKVPCETRQMQLSDVALTRNHLLPSALRAEVTCRTWFQTEACLGPGEAIIFQSAELAKLKDPHVPFPGYLVL